MNSQRLHLSSVVSLIWVSLFFGHFNLFAQPCPDDNQFWYDGQQPPCNSFGFVSIGGGTYATFNVEDGMTYTFTTCNSPFNTMLTGYDLSGNLKFFNDDNGPECNSDKASVEWLADFTGTIKVLVDSFPCTSFSWTSAVLEYRQTVRITSSDAAMCSGETRNLSANSTTGTFSGTGVTGNIFIAPAAGGTYPITYTLGVCSTTQFIQVNANPLISIISLDGLSFCAGDSVRLKANASSSNATITDYQWKQNGLNVGANSQIYTTSQADSYTAKVTDSNACSSESSSITISELQRPAVTISGLDSDYCITDASAMLTGSPPGGVFSGTGIAGSTFVPFAAGVGSHTIKYRYTAPNGCDAADTKTTIVNDKPVISFTINPASFCVNDRPITLNATPSGGTYSGTGVSGNIFDPATAGAGGPFIISYTFTDTIGCRSTSSANQGITVKALPAIYISGIGSEYCVSSSPVTLSGSPAGGNFSGEGVSGNKFYPDSAGTGTKQIIYSYIDNNGCSNMATASTTVQSLPNVTLSGLYAVYCADDGVVFMTGTPPGGSYSGEGVIANSFDPGLAGAGGPYDIIYTYTDVNGCSNNAQLQVGVNTAPALLILGLDSAYCDYVEEVDLALVPAGGQLTGSGISGNSFNPSQAGIGNHLIVYVYSDAAGCINSITKSVVVDACVGIVPVESAQLEIFPNPAQDIITIQISGVVSSESQLSIFNTNGQKMLEEFPINNPNNFSTIDLSAFPKGIYMFRLETANGFLQKKVVVN